MISSKCRREIAAIVLSSAILVAVLIWTIILITTTDGPSTVTRSGKYTKGCNEYGHNLNTGEVECVARNKPSRKWAFYVPVIWMAVVLILIFKRVYTNLYKSDENQPRTRREWVLERPVVAISTVSGDYNIGGTTTIPSAPPHTIALPPADQDAPPPEYLPPPAYNECVINMSDYDYRTRSDTSRII